MQKFKGYYMQAVSLKKSDCTDNDVMLHAYAIWKEDERSNFILENAWRLLKDQPKWLDQFSENCSKRTKIFTYRVYSSSSNPETLVEDAKADTLSPIIRPMGQKEAKRRSKGKGINSSNVNQNQAKLTHIFSTSVQRKPKKVNRQ